MRIIGTSRPRVWQDKPTGEGGAAGMATRLQPVLGLPGPLVNWTWVASGRIYGVALTAGRYGAGPVQANGMCLAEFDVYSKSKPNASTERIVDLPQVASCGPGPVSLPCAFIKRG